METIIVTTQFRAQDVQDVPVAVTAISADMLEARGQTNIAQVSGQAPNVQLSSYGQDGGSAMLATIRGVGQIDFNYAMEPGVGLYVDDVYYPTLTGSMVELLDLERVEILRGPQGTLAGRNAIGGVIKLYSQEPAPGGKGYAELSVGEYSRIGLKGAANMTIVDDKLYARFSGVSRSRDGYMERLDYRCMNPSSPIPSYSHGDSSGCVLGLLGGESFTAGRVQLLFTPSDNLRIKFIGDITNSNNDSGAQTLVRVNEGLEHTNGYGEGTFYDIDGDLTTTNDRVYYSNEFVTFGRYRPADAVVNSAYVTYSTFLDPNSPLPTRPYSPVSVDPGNQYDQKGGSLHIDWDINDHLSFLWVAALQSYKDTWAQDTDGSPINLQLLTQTQRHRHYTDELRLTGQSFNDKLDWTMGYFHVKQARATLEANVDLYYAQLNFVHGPDKTPSDSKAIYGSVTWHMTDNFNLTVGARDTDDHKDYTYYRRNPDGTLPAPCTGNPSDLAQPANCALAGLFGVSDSFSSSHTDGRLAVDWHLSDSAMVYLQNSSGYKVGGLNPRPYILGQLGPFKEETLETNEFGFKTELANQRVRLNGAVFSNDYKDIQLQLLQCAPVFTIPCLKPENVGDASSDGVEIELEVLPTSRLGIDFSLSNLDFKYTSVNPETLVTKSMKTPWTPDNTYSAGIEYEWPVSNGGAVSIRFDTSWVDDVYTDAINSPDNLIPAHSVGNLRITWRSARDDWEAAIEVTNVGNQTYFSNIYEQYYSSGQVAAGIAPPKMATVILKKNFSLD